MALGPRSESSGPWRSKTVGTSTVGSLLAALLRNKSLVGRPLANADYPSTAETGMSLMSILADCCAGDSLSRVTDYGTAYAAPPTRSIRFRVWTPLASTTRGGCRGRSLRL